MLLDNQLSACFTESDVHDPREDHLMLISWPQSSCWEALPSRSLGSAHSFRRPTPPLEGDFVYLNCERNHQEDIRPSCLSFRERSRTVCRSSLYPSRCSNRNHSPVHPPSPQYKCRRQTENHVRLDPNQGCRPSLLKPRLQESRCRLEQAV